MKYEKLNGNTKDNVKLVLGVSLLVIVYILIRFNIPSFKSTENLGLLILMSIILVITFRKKIS